MPQQNEYLIIAGIVGCTAFLTQAEPRQGKSLQFLLTGIWKQTGYENTSIIL